MHRLFVAIRPPQPIRKRLLDLMEGVPNARWQDEEQLHVTLRFIGEVDRHQAEDVAAALDRVSQPRFEIRLSGVGSFAKRGKGTLWVGLTPRDELKMLHDKVDQACRSAGVLPDTRAYHPHITIARISPATGPLENFLRHWTALSSPPFAVEAIRLYESRLGSGGASYTTVARYPLGLS
jgi:2'-5' RNA ligase